MSRKGIVTGLSMMLGAAGLLFAAAEADWGPLDPRVQRMIPRTPESHSSQIAKQVIDAMSAELAREAQRTQRPGEAPPGTRQPTAQEMQKARSEAHALLLSGAPKVSSGAATGTASRSGAVTAPLTRKVFRAPFESSGYMWKKDSGCLAIPAVDKLTGHVMVNAEGWAPIWEWKRGEAWAYVEQSWVSPKTGTLNVTIRYRPVNSFNQVTVPSNSLNKSKSMAYGWTHFSVGGTWQEKKESFSDIPAPVLEFYGPTDRELKLPPRPVNKGDRIVFGAGLGQESKGRWGNFSTGTANALVHEIAATID